MREVLAQNVNRLMEQRFREHGNRPLALASAAGLSLSSVQRTLSRETGATVDTVEAFAKVFGLPAFQLLVPWGLLGELASSNPPTITAKREPLFHGRLRQRDKTQNRRRRRRA